MKKGDIRYYGKKKVMIIEPTGDKAGAIVQEIYMNEEGVEYPAGETFYCSNLKMELLEAITWEGRQIEKEKRKYKELEDKLATVQKDISIQIQANVAYLSKLKKVERLGKLKPQIQRVIDFISGDLKYVAKPRDYAVQTLEESLTIEENWSYRRYDGLKLITVIGKTDAGLDYNINDYGDGSGGNRTIIPCRNKKEAIKEVQKYIDSRLKEGLSIDIKKAIECGCRVPKWYIKQFIKEKNKNKMEEIARYVEKADTLNKTKDKDLEYYQSILNT